ncbi:MAG: dephospho-CoA kinase [Candidatus Caldatribacteriaceae bacterium]
MLRSTPSERIRVIGIGGGTASGKSTVASFFEEQDIPVLSLDDIARDLSQKGNPLWKRVVLLFGQSFLDERGYLKRRKLASVVFHSWRMLFLLNSLAHPLLFWETVRRLHRTRGKVVVVDGAVLFEAGFCPLLDFLLFVDAPPGYRLERLRKQGLREREIILRMKSQKFLGCLRRRASKILSNDTSLESLKREVSQTVRDWLSLEIEYGV